MLKKKMTEDGATWEGKCLEKKVGKELWKGPCNPS